MQTNGLPAFDMSVNTTGCCPKFNPRGWDNVTLHFEDKKFLRAVTKSAMHVPLNMDKVFTRVQKHMEEAGAYDPNNMLVLSRDVSSWEAEHLFAVTGDVPDEEMTTLSGDFITRVFEGPYRKAKDWVHDMEIAAKARGKTAKAIYMFYTTCPRCAKAYDQNYIVGVAQI